MVVVEIAGVNAEEMEISVEGKTLTVRGEREDRQRHLSRLYHQMEICCGLFERSVAFPAEVDPEQATATYSDGLLDHRSAQGAAAGRAPGAHRHPLRPRGRCRTTTRGREMSA